MAKPECPGACSSLFKNQRHANRFIKSNADIFATTLHFVSKKQHFEYAQNPD